MISELWTLKTPTELGKQPNGSFSAFGLFSAPGGEAGQSNWLQIGSVEKDFIINGLNKGNGWKWLCKYSGTIYILKLTTQGLVTRWPRISIGSGSTGPRNQVKVIGRIFYGGISWVKIDSIPKSANYGQYVSMPWPNPYVHRIYCDYSWTNLGDTPVGILYMPLFNPASGFRTSSSQNELWLPESYLYQQVTDVQAPPPPIQPGYSLSTITGPRGVTVHVLKIDPTQVKFYVTPSSTSGGQTNPIRPSDALNKWGLNAVWNGDGFKWLNNGQVQVLGSWVSEGHNYQQNTVEAPSLYISKDNKFSFQKPLSQWNTISFPNRLISAGAINGTLEALTVTPRTAMGWDTADSKLYVIVADGSEAQRIGLTKPETAKILKDLGCFEAILFDSGGSSSMAVAGLGRVSAANDDGQERAVGNCMGIY